MALRKSPESSPPLPHRPVHGRFRPQGRLPHLSVGYRLLPTQRALSLAATTEELFELDFLAGCDMSVTPTISLMFYTRSTPAIRFRGNETAFDRKLKMTTTVGVFTQTRRDSSKFTLVVEILYVLRGRQYGARRRHAGSPRRFLQIRFRMLRGKNQRGDPDESA